MKASKFFKKASVFKSELPSIDSVKKAFEEGAFGYREITRSELSAFGLIAPKATGEIITPLASGNGYILMMRTDEKIIPAASVNDELDKAVASIETQEGRRVGRKEKTLIKEDIVSNMALTAPVKPSYTLGYFDCSAGKVAIDGSKINVNRMLILFCNMMGSLETKTLHIRDFKQGLTTRLKGYLSQVDAGDEPDIFGGFYLSDACSLERKFEKEKKEKITFNGEILLDDSETSDQIQRSIDSGFAVESLRLVYKDLRFKLTSDFKISAIEYPEREESDQEEDPAFAFRSELMYRFLLIDRLTDRLLDVFDTNNEEEK